MKKVVLFTDSVGGEYFLSPLSIYLSIGLIFFIRYYPVLFILHRYQEARVIWNGSKYNYKEEYKQALKDIKDEYNWMDKQIFKVYLFAYLPFFVVINISIVLYKISKK